MADIRDLGCRGRSGRARRAEAAAEGRAAEERAARRAAEASGRRYRFLAKAIPQIVWTATPAGSLDSFNPRWTEYTGLVAHAGARTGAGGGRSTPRTSAAGSRAGSGRGASGAKLTLDLRLRRADGSYRWHLVHALPVRDRAGPGPQVAGDLHRHRRPEAGRGDARLPGRGEHRAGLVARLRDDPGRRGPAGRPPRGRLVRGGHAGARRLDPTAGRGPRRPGAGRTGLGAGPPLPAGSGRPPGRRPGAPDRPVRDRRRGRRRGPGRLGRRPRAPGDAPGPGLHLVDQRGPGGPGADPGRDHLRDGRVGPSLHPGRPPAGRGPRPPRRRWPSTTPGSIARPARPARRPRPPTGPRTGSSPSSATSCGPR